ncbi:MAG: UDP-N-acetylglucosamine diphosphorylase/glucosamine-1-phosphate N-acetyltransferase [Gammaproteobacteria bacterium]|nr:UDP-N-acetylglucosamine diphosphorylase/glucosamine-1-phosphate N-acetyltransferase [Gammaproteobacteria bacterium]
MILDVIILAAGKGTRMRSSKAKVLHELAGRSLISHVICTAQQLQPREVAVVVGHQANEVQASVPGEHSWILQRQQLGTGHAVAQAMAGLAGDGVVLVLYGDVPLINIQTLVDCCSAADAGQVGLVTAEFEAPGQLGRIVRDDRGRIQKIVEYKDANDEQRAICEINSGILAAPASKLMNWLAAIKPNNAQGEYYLTDIIAMAVADGVEVAGITALNPVDVTGVNDRAQLAGLEREFQRRQANRLMLDGVTIADPDRIDIRGEVSIGEDSFLDINVVLEGQVELGRGVRVGPGAVIINSHIGDRTQVHAHTVIEGAQVAEDCSLGPFARIRAGSELAEGVKIGNFVETKKAKLGPGTKAGHLAYLGDAQLGADCNIGAGTITCNYDGVNKHITTIGNNVFVGSNSTLIAPVTLEDNAFTAAGSTITSKVSDGDLAVGRAKQRNIAGWVRPDLRKKK